MALKDYFPKNEKKELVDKLAEATMTSRSTVYKWLKGDIVPPPLKRQVIADTIGEPIDKLFPDDATK